MEVEYSLFMEEFVFQGAMFHFHVCWMEGTCKSSMKPPLSARHSPHGRPWQTGTRGACDGLTALAPEIWVGPDTVTRSYERSKGIATSKKGPGNKNTTRGSWPYY